MKLNLDAIAVVLETALPAGEGKALVARAREAEGLEEERDQARRERDNLGESLRRTARYEAIAARQAEDAETETTRLRSSVGKLRDDLKDLSSRIGETLDKNPDLRLALGALRAAHTEIISIAERAIHPPTIHVG